MKFEDTFFSSEDGIPLASNRLRVGTTPRYRLATASSTMRNITSSRRINIPSFYATARPQLRS